MVEKRLLCPNRRRRTPAQFSWLDHPLVRDSVSDVSEVRVSVGRLVHFLLPAHPVTQHEDKHAKRSDERQA